MGERTAAIIARLGGRQANLFFQLRKDFLHLDFQRG